MDTKPSPTIKIWMVLAEPRAITFTMMVAYALFTLAGVSVYWEGVPRLEEIWPHWYTVAWGTFMAAGGVLGFVSSPRGIWLAERPAILLCGTGLAAYSASVLNLHLSGASGNQVVPWAVSMTGLLFLTTRWIRIRWAALDPTK